MKYHDVKPISREDSEKAFSSNNAEQKCHALVSLAFYESDWRYVQNQCLSYMHDEELSLKSAAVICIGHIARIHKKLDVDLVVKELKKILSDPRVNGIVEDALEDIKIYINHK